MALVEKEHGTAIVVVRIAVERDNATRANNDFIFDHAVMLAKKYGAPDSTEGRLRVELFDPG